MDQFKSEIESIVSAFNTGICQGCGIHVDGFLGGKLHLQNVNLEGIRGGSYKYCQNCADKAWAAAKKKRELKEKLV